MGDLPAGCVTLVWKVGEATQQVKQLAQRSGAAQSGNRIPAQVWLPGCRFFYRTQEPNRSFCSASCYQEWCFIISALGPLERRIHPETEFV